MFSRALQSDDLWEGELRRCVVDGVPVLLLRQGDGIFAYVDRCAHLGAPLSSGRLVGGRIVCAIHHWEYDACSGAGVNPCKVALVPLAVRVEGGVVWVDALPANDG